MRVLLALFLITSCTPTKVSTKRDTPYAFAHSSPYLQEEKGNTHREDSNKYIDKKGIGDIDDVEIDEDSKGKDIEGYEEVGYASYYGRRFHGMRTASGEIFDMYKMTAAHRTLPFGTIVEVENLENGRKVRVKINDRGPFARDRIIDLSYAAAKKLGFVKKGTARVRIRVIGMGKIEPLEEETHEDKDSLNINYLKKKRKRITYREKRDDVEYSGRFIVQLGVFSVRKNAYRLKRNIEEDFENLNVKVKRDGDFYKVYIDGFKTREKAKKLAEFLKENGYDAFVKDIEENDEETNNSYLEEEGER